MKRAKDGRPFGQPPDRANILSGCGRCSNLALSATGGSVMGNLTEDPETFFGFARSMLAHAALDAPADSDRFILTSGLAKIATGLEILSAELKDTHKDLLEVKELLRQMQRRASMGRS